VVSEEGEGDVTTEVPALPEGAVLLHIGPYKTGSTAIQQALFDRRDVLAEHGVYYPGRWRRLFREGHSLMQWSPRGRPVPPVSVWDDFAADIRRRRDVRACLSTEDFGRIREAGKAQKVVEDLGADRLHLIAVARAYHRLMPSHWQERVKSHERRSYDEWLHELLEDGSSEVARSFWTSHDVEYMTSRWLDVLPADRFTFVVTDDADRDLLPRTFERLLGLPDGLLGRQTDGQTDGQTRNASLSMNAVELLRRVNGEFAERGWSDRDYVRLVQSGLVPELQAAGRSVGDVPVPPLPGWARPLVAERSERRVSVLERLGVPVVGDPACLLLPELPVGDEQDLMPERISVEAASRAVVGVVAASLEPAKRPSGEQSRQVVPQDRGRPIAAAGGRELASALVRRVGSRLMRRPARRPSGDPH
jgi:hypothetical protein